MAFIDGTVVNVALPAIQRDLHASAFEAQWVVESYALFLAALLLVGGSLGDRFGRRRVFMIGVGLFGAASIACALSGNVGHLIMARGLQGVGAALLVPGSLALISASFPEAERGRAIGTWSAFSGITAALGPVIGGWLIEHYTYRWAFLINVPVGLVVCGLAWLQVPESRGSARGPIDSWGALSATLGLAGIVYALIEGPNRGWGSTPVLGALAGAAAMRSVFVRVERRQPAAMLPLALFRIHNFAGANLLTLLLYAALSGALFFFPLNLIQVQGYSATEAGAALLPLIAVMSLLSRWAGALLDRLGAKLPLIVGPSIAALGFGLFARPSLGGSYWSTFLPAVVVLGFGMSITVAPLTTTVMNSVSQDLAGTASGVNNAVSRAAGLLAIAGFGILMTSVFEASLNAQLAALHVPPDLTALLWEQRSKLAGMRIPARVDAVAAARLTRAVGLAFVTGFRWVMGLSVALALLSALTAWLAIDGKRPAASAT
jgi:EmrB/QacA subfamily drug resistance transporter